MWVEVIFLIERVDSYIEQILALEQAHEYYENNKFDIIANKVRADL